MGIDVQSSKFIDQHWYFFVLPTRPYRPLSVKIQIRLLCDQNVIKAEKKKPCFSLKCIDAYIYNYRS